MTSYEQKNKSKVFSLRPGMIYLQLRLGFGASGQIGADGYGNTLACDDVVRVSGEEKWSDAHNWVKGLVDDGEWASAPDQGSSTPPVKYVSTGKYRLYFDDEYLGISGFKWGIEDSSNTNKYNVVLVSFTASDSTYNKGRSSALIQFVDKDNNATDPDNGSYLWLELALKTSEQG